MPKADVQYALEGLAMLDHLVYAVPDLDAAVKDVTERLGVTPSPGGQHIDWGTRNYLLSLGEGAYLEIIGPDSAGSLAVASRPFGLDSLQHPRLVAWAVSVMDIERCVEVARTAGYDPGLVVPMSRTLPDGAILHWKLTRRADAIMPDPIPFLIEWGRASHPSTTASQGTRLLEFRAQSPSADDVCAKLDALGVALPVHQAERTELIARLVGPAGHVTLR
jgi:hypothetical protein